jgi:hypothetical protein
MNTPAPTPTSKRVCCKLCTCEGVKGTVLCTEHLEGFAAAAHLLNNTGRPLFMATARSLLNAIKQPQEAKVIALATLRCRRDDNGQDGT